jgi:hypothetical protein
MKTSFEERLNQILPRLASPDVLDNRGAGGEIGFWIFDYPPEHEMQMRSWLADVIEPGLHKLKPGLRFATIDLFECVISLLEERGLLTKALDMQLKHTLLSALHPHMRDTPLLMLYPGRYDGQSLRLFSKLTDDNYYRAFSLVS